MDTLLLEYKLKAKGIERGDLLREMGWSESTRQARILRGENWQVEELKTLQRLGFSFEELAHIFFSQHDHKSGQSDEEALQ